MEKRVLPNNPTLTHSYDGKLEKTKLQLIKDISRASVVPLNVKLEAFAQLREHLKRILLSPQASRCFEVIVHTFSQAGHVKNSPNYDPTNDLFADDLLYLCFEQIVVERNEDLARALILQLEDMSTGLCAQGRTTRLFQILLAYRA